MRYKSVAAARAAAVFRAGKSLFSLTSPSLLSGVLASAKTPESDIYRVTAGVLLQTGTKSSMKGNH